MRNNKSNHKKIPTWLMKVYDFKSEKKALSIVLVSLPGVISFLVSIFSNYFDETSRVYIHIVGVFCFAMVVTTLIIFQVSDALCPEVNISRKDKDLNFHLRAVYFIDQICKSKLHTLIDYVNKLKKNPDIEPAKIINKPCNQLRLIVQNVSNALSQMLDGTTNNFHTAESVRVSILYKLNDVKDSKWEIVETDTADYPDIEDFTESRYSFFSYAMDEKEKFVLGNNKQLLHEQKRYIECAADTKTNGKLNGSIAYYKIPLNYSRDGKSNTLIDAVIMLYTCGTSFAENDEQDSISTAKYNLETFLDKFKLRIHIELCLYYIYYLRKKHNENQELDCQK